MTYQQFLEQYNNLKLSMPVEANHNTQSEDSDYGDYLSRCRSSFYSFDNADCRDIVYIFDSFKAINCCDGDYVIESENIYEGAEAVNANNCSYITYCTRIYDSHFSWHCHDSNNLFGCVYLKNKQFCIFNRQYSKEEYELRIKELLKRPAEANLKEMEEVAMRFPTRPTHVSKSENSEYNNQVHYSKNLYLCFDSTHSENCAYMYDAHYNKNCYDITQSFHSEFCYECVNSSKLNNCFFMDDCTLVYDSAFCENCSKGNHLFGCVNLDNKEYYILNKKYTPTEYDKEAKEIMETYK